VFRSKAALKSLSAVEMEIMPKPTLARRFAIALLLLFLLANSARTADIPEWLPRYDMHIRLDVEERRVAVTERVTWTNRHCRPAEDLTFTVYPRYQVPKEDLALVAKTLELLRTAPSDAIDGVGRRLTVERIMLGDQPLAFHYRGDMQTALVVPLPHCVRQGEQITVEITFVLDLPEKQGRWGYYQGITFLANWYPMLAFYDEKGWQPTPFVPWHQPFFNEAGVYSVWLELPKDQKVASSGTLREEAELPDGFKRMHLLSPCARDFAIVSSNRFVELSGDAEGTKVRVLALPEHEHLARKALEVACEAIPMYNRWFGRYPFEEFDIAESHFPWNGNECAGMIMIDARVFSMPHMGEMYIDHLVSHETLHQWWYNVVGTNGYCETWMDEALACYFTARRLQAKYGFNAPMLNIPHWLEACVPNLYHENYRFSGMYNTIAHKEDTPTIQPLPLFGNVFTLFSMTYDRGAKLLGMIADRLGDAAFMDFMRLVYCKYQFRIIRVTDFQHELEQYTGRSWDEFFGQWFYGKGMSDWAVEDVKLRHTEAGTWTARVVLQQKAEFTEQTVLGVKFQCDGPYEIHLPIIPAPGPIDIDDPPTHIETLSDGKTVVVDMELPMEPAQISVDPDQVLPDSNPANNHWKPPIRWRIAPLYTNLDETDLMTDYDKWNVTMGPWIGLTNPAFGQVPYAGFRAGAYRLQEFVGGLYAGYNAYNGDVRLGGDALIQNWPWPNVDLGFQADHSVTPELSHVPKTIGIAFGRYVFHQTPSLYMEPMEYLEVYSRTGAIFWPGNFGGRADFGRFQDVGAIGLLYNRNYLTPYWDPEAGYRCWINYECGKDINNEQETFQRVQGELSYVQSMPCGLGYISDTRLAFRAYGGIGEPNSAQLFQLGGPNRIRGLNWNTRDGNAVWIATAEWRFPIWRDLDYDLCDHVLRTRHIYGVAYYDTGEVFIDGHTIGGIVHSLGTGLRLDMAVFSFIERFTLRLDIAKVMRTNEPVQVWFGLSHAF
jgi:hypothetical protein